MKKQFFSILVLLVCLGSYSQMYSINVQADPGWITVTNPYAGTWYTGDNLYISWSSQNAGNYVDIILFMGNSQSITIASDVSNYGSTGNYNWLISGGISTGSTFRIKIVSTTNQSIFSFSNYFTLYNRFISVYSPNTEDVWYEDEPHSISWTSGYVQGSVQMSLYKNDAAIMTISSSIPCAQGTYQWTIPNSITPGTSYRIFIQAIGYSGITSYSGYFSIKKRTIKVTTPTKDTVWYLNEIYQITWVSDHAGSGVDISLYEKNTDETNFHYSRSIIAGTDNDGRQTWSIPSSLSPNSEYRIYIQSTSYATVYNYSEIFRVEERFIRVTSPGNSNIWYIGDVYNITWDSHNAGELVTIDLYQNGAQKAVLVSNITNNGVFTWRVPFEITPDSSSQIKIKSASITTVYGISESFSLSKKSIEITSVAETEHWSMGEHYDISWDSKGFSSNVKIELYAEAGVVVTIMSNVTNSGNYEWMVPSDLSSGSMYKIKITSVSDESIYGYSQGYLVIEATFLQQWSGTIILFSAISLGFVVAYLFIIRKWRRRIAAEKNDQESGLVQVHPEQLSPDEYENIWEKNRD
jgi:hypothetical protein